MNRRISCAAILALCACPTIAKAGVSDSLFRFPAGSIVIEGESADTTNFTADLHDPLFTDSSAGKVHPRSFPSLHGGKASLLNTKDKPRDAYRAVYRFSVPAAQTTAAPQPSALWVFEQGREWACPIRWRIDTLPWQPVSTHLLMRHQTRLAADGPTFAWTRLGTAGVLTKGTHRLEIEATGPRANGVWLLSQDCFVFMPGTSPVARPYTGESGEPTARSIWLWGDTDSIPGSRVADGFRPWLEPYPVQTARPRGAVVVFPGGAYVGRAPSEGEPVARAFNAQGYHVFVCQYRVSPHRHPEQLMDAAQAVRLVRGRAKEWNVDPRSIAVCGFSAGGHLAAMLGVHYAEVPKGPGLDSVSARPDAMVLGYPWLSSTGSFTPAGPLLGDDAAKDKDLARFIVPDQWVTARTPTAFLWHCADDGIDVRGSMAFADSLHARKVPFELHVYHKGGHGLGVAAKDPHVGTWVSLAGGWLGDLGWLTPLADVRGLRDSVYKGAYTPERGPYVTWVDLGVKGGKISSVKWAIYDTANKSLFDSTYEGGANAGKKFIEQCRKDWTGSRAYGRRLIETQDIDQVDAVSGATWTHMHFVRAVKDALRKAVR